MRRRTGRPKNRQRTPRRKTDAKKMARMWSALLESCASVFHCPSLPLFVQLASAWVLCPARHTVTRMLETIAPAQCRPHDAYHRFVRAGAWLLAELWAVLAKCLIATLAAPGVLPLVLDDTLLHKSGRRVNGAGTFRDAVRSTSARVVYAWGLNLVVLGVRVTPPWGGEPLALPINVRLHRKGGRTMIDLAEEMVCEVADWFPERRFALTADGAYATLAGRDLPRTQVTSRMRRDAALYEAPPPRRPGRRGRPAKRGRRLPTPETMARRQKQGWARCPVDIRGRSEQRLLWSRPVLWYGVCPDHLVLLVVVRDPDATEHDDFFFTTDLKAASRAVASQYAGRWSIEDTFRNDKQFLGAEDPQCWQGEGPERAAALSFWIYSAVWLCYITTCGDAITWTQQPWYSAKRAPSFSDALAVLRRSLWRSRIFSHSHSPLHTTKIIDTLIDALARAA